MGWPLAQQMGVGGMLGFCSGYAFKKAGKLAAVTVGCGFVILQTLQYQGLININWSKVQETVEKNLDQDGDFDQDDVKILAQKMFGMLKYQLPSSAGFGTG